MPSARWWKDFYARERAALGEAGLCQLLDTAPTVTLPAGGALVFPHARLTGCGPQVAAVAHAIVDSGADLVLALGVLHGAREQDADLVCRARAGSHDAMTALRRVHGPGAPHDAGHWTEEFSLDNLNALVEVAARRAGRHPPRLVARHPFLVGEDPDDLPGLDELHELFARGGAIVATADHVHHGAGYRTPPERCLPASTVAALAHARGVVEASCEMLQHGNLRAFLRLAQEESSDFRDSGPVIADILAERGPWEWRLADLALVGYADVLECPEPTWVAAALVSLTPTPNGRHDGHLRQDGCSRCG